MGNVYAVDTHKNLIIYSTGNYICLRTSVGENLTRPIILCNDYASDLSDIVYNNTIYYAYQNTNQDIILRSVIERDDLYKISSRNTPDCFYPQIVAIQNTLILFYFVKNPVDNSYRLKTLFPLQPEQKFILPESIFSPNAEPDALGEAVFSSLPILRILPVGTALFIHLTHDMEEFIFTINESLQCNKLVSEHSISLEELTEYKEKSRKSDEILSMTQTELDKNKELLANTQTQISKLQSELSSRDQLIQSIRRQYEELMDTATKYREEAVKWHSRFYGK
ncbi:MAG: hypothetical protein NC433_17260 [Clostridiales bacterium]|nr:hypothetical protein [Clostridiales bacterium]